MSTVTLGVEVNGTDVSGYRYSPGETVSLIVNFTDPAANSLGFVVMARSGPPVAPDRETRCGPGGSMAVAPTADGTTVKVRNGDEFLSTRPEPCGESLREVWWATHTRPTQGSSAAWEVSWTLPSEDLGPITLMVVINAANGDRQTSGDNIYTQTYSIARDGPVSPPQITGFGDVLAGPAGTLAQGAPGAIASLTGEHFMLPGSAPASMLDESGRLATKAGGTCVQVGVGRAPLVQVSPERVTFQIPPDVGLGNSMVRVIRGCDTDQAVSSEPASIVVVSARPTFLQFSDDDAGLAALHRNLSLVAPAGAVEGRRTRPAIPGDAVVLFGTGFGRVKPAYPGGEIARELRPLDAADLRVMLGSLEIDAAGVQYAGAAPDFAGLQQLVFQVPENTPAGSHDLGVFLGGVQSLAGPKLEVATAESILPSTECSVGLALGAMESCVAMFSSGTGVLEVDADGKACVLGSTEDLDMWECGVETLDLSGHGAAIDRNEDGTWTISALPEPGEEKPLPCEVGMSVKPGESCSAVILGIEALFEVSEEGVACARAPSVNISLCEMEGALDLSSFGAGVERNDDGSWSVTKLP